MILRSVRELYVAGQVQGARSPSRASLALPRQYAATVRTVTDNLRRYPLARLQRPAGYREGQEYDRPLYDDRLFGESSREVDLRLYPGAGERLLALSGLLIPALQSEWTQQVASLNALPFEHLRGHLFGQQRADLTPVREALRDLQRQECLYCGERLRTGGQVDHVVPWSLHPQDAIENLVLAHDRCNAAKSAYLLDLEPLTTWVARDLGALARAAADLGWASRPATVLSLARTAYTHAGSSALWSSRGVRLPAPGDVQRRILPLLQVDRGAA